MGDTGSVLTADDGRFEPPTMVLANVSKISGVLYQRRDLPGIEYDLALPPPAE